MSKNIFFSEYFDSINKAIQSLDCSLLERVSRLIDSCKEGKKKLIIVGNGGSSAIARQPKLERLILMRLISLHASQMIMDMKIGWLKH